MTVQLNLTPFDQIECWGQPWHGVMAPGGAMTMDAGGVVKTGGIPDLAGGQAQLVMFPGLPEPITEDYETALGMAWKNYAILAGNHRWYAPFGGYAFGVQSWLYRCADGTVYKLQMVAPESTTLVEIWAGRVADDSSTPAVIWTGLSAHAGWLRLFTASDNTCLSASADGSKAIVVVSIGSPSLSLYGSLYLNNTIFNAPEAAQAYEIAVTGGSATSPPGISVSPMSADFIDDRGYHTSLAAQTVTDHLKFLVAAWVKPNGTVQKTYLEAEVSRVFISGYLGPGSTGALSSIAADVYLTTNEGRLLVNHMDAVANLTFLHVDASGDVYGLESTTANNWPMNAGAVPGPGFSVSIHPNLDFSVLGIESNGVPKIVGGLGSVRTDVAISDFIKSLCQHPITGELHVDRHVF